MKKCKASLLAALLLFLTVACTVQVEEKIVEKIVEKTVTVSMEKSEYGLFFEMEGKKHNFIDTQFMYDKIVYQEYDYMRQWFARNFGDYRGPLSFVQVGKGFRGIHVYPLLNDTKDRVGSFFVVYDDIKNSWLVQCSVSGADGTEWMADQIVQPELLDIHIHNGNLYISFDGNIEMTKKLKDGTTSKVVATSLFAKSKILNNSSSNWQVVLSGADYFGSDILNATGVSRKQEIKLSFYKYLSPGNLVNPFFTDTNYVKEVTAMDKTIDYLYVNGEKVTGSWDAAGKIFTYTPTVPYPANTKMVVVVPEDMRDIEGALLCMPFPFRFTTSGKSVGTPQLIDASKNAVAGVTLMWKQMDYDKVESYNIYRADSKDGEYMKVDTFTPDLTGKLDGNFYYTYNPGQADKSYFYKVTANSAAEGESEMSGALEGVMISSPL